MIDFFSDQQRGPRSKMGVLLFSMLVLIGGIGCSGGSNRVAVSPEEAFNRGKASFDDEKYTTAIELLQTVFDFGRAHQWAGDAQILLAQAYFNTEQFLLAANEFDRFAQLYPADGRVEEAEYKRALCYYRLSPPFDLDQSDTERAITYLRLYVNRYPQGAFSADIGNKIDELQEKLSRKLFEGARLYARQEQYESAAITYGRVLDKYPNTSLADDALYHKMKAYIAFSDASIRTRQAERLELAVEAYNQLVQLFPNSPLLKDAELLYDGIVERQKDLFADSSQ
jgi:outer membrane protein assembly factor BamD